MPRTPPLLAALSLVGALAGASPCVAQDAGDRSYRAATGLLNRGMNEAAVAEYTTLLRTHKAHPRIAHARYGLAVALVRLGRTSEAMSALDELPNDPSFEFAPDASLLRAQCAAAQGDWAQAARACRLVTTEFADSTATDGALALLGESLYRAGEHGAAREQLAGHLDRYPKSPARDRAAYLLALCEISAGEDGQAARRLEALRRESPASALLASAALAEAQCRHRMEDAPAARTLYSLAAESADAGVRAEALLGLSRLARSAGDGDGARSTLDRLIGEHPDSPAAVLARFERALLTHETGSHADALAELSALAPQAELIGADRLAYWSARCESASGSPELAARRLARAERAFAASPLLVEMLFERASALERAGQEERAIDGYRAVVSRFPDHPRVIDALLAHAAVAHRQGRYGEARDAASEVLRLSPDHPGAPDAALLIAESAYLLGEFESAERAYAGFLGRFPRDARSWRALVRRGLCLARLDRRDECVALLSIAIDAPHEPDAALEAAAAAALGDIASSQDDWPAAERWLRRLTDGPADADPAALLALGIAIQRQGRTDDSIRAFERVERAAPASEPARRARFERAQALASTDRLDEARRALDEVVRTEPEGQEANYRAPALRHLASIASRQGRPEEAASYLAQLPGADPEAALDLALMRLSAGDFADAERGLREFLSRSPVHPRRAEAIARRAAALNRLGRPEDALACLGETTDSALPPDILDEARAERGWALSALGRADEAAEVHRTLLAGTPPAALASRAALALAQTELAGDTPERALEHLDRAEREGAGLGEDARRELMPRVAYLRGAAYSRLERYREAAGELAALLDDGPPPELATSATLLCADALVQSQRHADAAKRLSALATSEPDDATLRAVLPRLGDACASAGDWTASEEAYASFLRRFPDDPMAFHARFGIGWARENTGRHEQAIEAYHAVTDGHDGATAARAQFQIGECLYALKRYDDAVTALLKVDILYSEPQWSAAALYEAGRCLAEQGKHTEAREQFKQVIERFGATNWARLASERIKDTRPAPVAGR